MEPLRPSHASAPTPRAAEFFAGIGLARLGLEKAGIEVTWSNDISIQKGRVYNQHFGDVGGSHFTLGDLREVIPEDLPNALDLAWASFPCTDLSVAGTRAGIHRGIASSTFWHFIKLLSKLGSRKPRVVAIENVTAFATSHSGQDIESAISSLNGLGYSVDILSIDAKLFVPQSRPRLFLIASLDPRPHTHSVSEIRPPWLNKIYENSSLKTHQTSLPVAPTTPRHRLYDVVEGMSATDSRWWDSARVDSFVESLAPVQRKRYNELRSQGTIAYRTAYRRMRNGVPRWEIRNDEIAGCLRTARGGSSKQALVEVLGTSTRVRWMTPLEYARLMGAGDYNLSGLTQREAFNGFGDAVCVPVVEWLGKHYLVPQIEHARTVASASSITQTVDSSLPTTLAM